MKRSKNNLRVLQVLNDAELLLSPTEITGRVFGEVNVSTRTMTSQTIRRLMNESLIAESERHLFEITDKGISYLNTL